MRHLIEPEGNRAAVRWLRENSKRPIAAMNLWSLLLAKLHYDSGDILLSRVEIAGEVGITPREVSSIMKELESIEAIKRQPEGREVTYSMNRKLFVVPLGKAQEDARQMPVFEIVESKEEEAEEGLWPNSKGERYSVGRPRHEREVSSWTPEEAGNQEYSRESDFDALRRTTTDIWQYWRDRLLSWAKRKEDD